MFDHCYLDSGVSFPDIYIIQGSFCTCWDVVARSSVSCCEPSLNLN